MLLKLEKLRQLRRTMWASQGRLVNTEGEVSLQDLIKKAQEQVKEEQRELYKNSLDQSQPQIPIDDHQEEQQIDPIKDFYSQADQNLEKLISIRRNWDTYLVPIGMGTRIPQRFPSPPPPSSSAWENYLVIREGMSQ